MNTKSSKTRLRIATRKSQLAVWQAEFVKKALETAHPQLSIEIHTFSTEGDRRLDVSLSKIGGKGLFVKELEHALLSDEADIAVHSLKDMPMQQPENLSLVCMLKRHNPHDVLLSKQTQLSRKAVIGTSSFRRQCQLRQLYPHAQYENLRGNINTRINKMLNDEYDAIVLAAAGVERLGLTDYVTHQFSSQDMLPTAGQGVLTIECRHNDEEVKNLLAPLNHPETSICVHAERDVVTHLHGDCKTPIAAYATLNDDEIYLRALVGMPNGSKMLYSEKRAKQTATQTLGRDVADDLLEQGADEIIKAVKSL